ncbi:S-4TM family putative pore-forming effector [uncultured Thiodictyon sp.]|jgi:hypothetical protein|uniref:S-4TM family putative pore-forming effector n=1 Tax=uncultured Thiodictyon sp. TaxID=1846217 RepID=UPI0025E0D4E1|nr:S-4TM family putative pore-forming effector [uncultured Thiodictyon sp.]
MNAIPSLQNENPQIQRLAAQRALYAQAKVLMNWQFLIAGPLTLAVGLATMFIGDLAVLGVVWVIGVLIASHVYFEPKQERLRELAASIQEAFDCDVLELPWRSTRIADMPDAESVADAARAYWTRGGDRAGLTDWYAPAVGQLPLHLARLVCQRQNCWWDGRLRRAYAMWLLVVLIGLLAVMVLLGWALGLTMAQLLIQGIVPLIPLLDLGRREYREQIRAAERVDELKRCSKQFWDAALDGQAQERCAADAREFQDAIFTHRGSTQPVPDLLYDWLRERYNSGMNEGAAQWVQQARARLGERAADAKAADGTSNPPPADPTGHEGEREGESVAGTVAKPSHGAAGRGTLEV